MNVIVMPEKVLVIANSVISKSSLPNLPASELKPECVRVSTFDQLNALSNVTSLAGVSSR